ncbi:MAG: metallophosphoesterase family protein [Eubacterium sp.]|nr:metallophosphoesterase family protein [Eubacterium sp.]
MARYVILCDIHGNMPALTAVVEDIRARAGYAGIFLLGDLIDYGMQSNEVVSYVRDELSEKIGAPVITSIWGNHERAVMTGDYSRLSSERTVASAQYTASILTEETKEYIREQMVQEGWSEYSLPAGGQDGDSAVDAGGTSTVETGLAGSGDSTGQSCLILSVHGSIDDIYFGSILPEDVQGNYSGYDLVLSGHTHFPHIFTRFYMCEDERLRGKRPVVFINPGSVGQPRNRNPFAQYAVWDSDTGTAELRAVPYDVEKAMSMYHGQVDDFYRDRLARGV